MNKRLDYFFAAIPMKTLTATILFIAAVLATLLLNTACTKLHRNESTIFYGMDGERVHISEKLTTMDLVSLAGLTTEKMLASDVIRKWRQRPRIVVAVPENTTRKADLQPEDLQDEIIARMLDAGVARIVDEENVSFRYDYIVKTVLSNSRQPGAERKKITSTPRIVYYTCTQSLLSRRGEQLGRWYSTIQVMEKQPTAPQ